MLILNDIQLVMMHICNIIGWNCEWVRAGVFMTLWGEEIIKCVTH